MAANAEGVGGRTADRTEGLLGKAGFLFEESGEALFAVFVGAMQIKGTPCAILAIEELVGTAKFIGVGIGVTAIGAAPILNDVPVSPLTAITGGNETLCASGGVKAADEGGALLGEVARQDTLILQTPEDDRR